MDVETQQKLISLYYALDNSVARLVYALFSESFFILPFVPSVADVWCNPQVCRYIRYRKGFVYEHTRFHFLGPMSPSFVWICQYFLTIFHLISKVFCVEIHVSGFTFFSKILIRITMIKITLPVQGTAGSKAEQSTPEGLG
jgi:hypothetical protein